ncbi:MAG: hypothetical protein CML06_20235 [Pseudomonadales bacterium]|nr:hypothetical protein [Pseudomonadales bacterium]
MKQLTGTATVLGLLMITTQGFADSANSVPMGLDSLYLNVGYDWTDVDDADFDETFSAELGARWRLQNPLYLETAVAGVNGPETERKADNTGQYQLTLNGFDLLAGLQYRHPLGSALEAQVRGGLLWYRLELELEEEFFSLKQGGTDSETDQGWGYYLGAGVSRSLNSDWRWSGSILYRQRRDMLGDSERPFDVTSFGLAAGIARSF